MAITHPEYLPGKPEDGTPEEEGENKDPRRLTVAAEGEVIPLAYGKIQTKGKVFAANLDTGYWYVGVLWCEGEIEEITKIWADDILIYPDTDPDYVEMQVDVVNYTGTTTQVADPWLVAAFTGYTDTLIQTIGGEERGIAYTVVKFKEVADPPLDTEKAVTTNFTCLLKGLKVSTTGLQSDPKTYSTNPSLCLADFITSKFHGEGELVNATSVATCAAVNDESVTLPEGGTALRNTINLIIDNVASTSSHRSDLQRYAACFYTHEDGEVKLIPDRPRAVDYTFDENNIIVGTSKIGQRGMRTAATSMRLSYTNTMDSTDTYTDVWTTGYATYTDASASSGSSPWRETSIGMLGIDNYAEAYRAAVEALNKILLVTLDLSFTAFDDGIKVQMGDVINVTHPIGLIEYPFRVMSAVPDSPGRYKITGYTYDENVYSDPDTETPVTPEPPEQPSIPIITNLQVWEECFLHGDVWKTIVKASWDAVTLDVPFTYFTKISSSTHANENTWTSNLWTRSSPFSGPTGYPANFIDLGVCVKVQITSNGDLGDALCSMMTKTPDDSPYGVSTIYGQYYFPPDRAENLTEVSATQADTSISWDAVSSVGGVTYEVQVFENGAGHTWDSATDRLFVISDLSSPAYGFAPGAAGSYEFLVKAINILEHYNHTESSIVVVVT